MVEFGHKLKREREGRGMSVDQVCAITKVSARNIAALEAGHLEELPGGVFRKGIVRSYVAAVGLDEAAWMEHYETSLRASGGAAEPNGAEWVEFAENVKRNRAAPGPPTGMRWLGVALMFLLLLVCGWLAWKYVLRERLTVRTGTIRVLPPASVRELDGAVNAGRIVPSPLRGATCPAQVT